jgi:hypothetical protein
LCAVGGIRCQRRRALEEGRGSRRAAARLCSRGRSLEFSGHLLVGRGCGVRTVPGAPVGVEFRIGRFAESPVNLASFVHPSGSIDGRAHQRVTERDAWDEDQQVFGFEGVCGRRWDVKPLGRPPHQGRVSDRIGRCDQQQAPGVPGEPRQAPREALLDAGRQRHSRWQAEPARELRRAQPARELQKSERVPVRLENDPLQHTSV